MSAAVLVGGASSRMGEDKAHLRIGGIACATRVATLLDRLFEEVTLVGGSPPASAPGRRVPDPKGPSCALRGLVAALDASEAAAVLVVATDLPLLTRDLVLALVAAPEAPAVVPRSASGVHPLCALYQRAAVLSEARARLARKRLALQSLLEEIGAAYLSGEDLAAVDPEGVALTNVNTPEDRHRAEQLLARRNETFQPA